MNRPNDTPTVQQPNKHLWAGMVIVIVAVETIVTVAGMTIAGVEMTVAVETTVAGAMIV